MAGDPSGKLARKCGQRVPWAASKYPNSETRLGSSFIAEKQPLDNLWQANLGSLAVSATIGARRAQSVHDRRPSASQWAAKRDEGQNLCTNDKMSRTSKVLSSLYVPRKGLGRLLWAKKGWWGFNQVYLFLRKVVSTTVTWGIFPRPYIEKPW